MRTKHLPHYPGYKVMALFPVQGYLAFRKSELVASYKAIEDSIIRPSDDLIMGPRANNGTVLKTRICSKSLHSTGS